MLPMRSINAHSPPNQLYPVLSISSEKTSLTCATSDAPKRMASATSPPAVPPRPDKALVQERLLHVDLKNKSNSIDRDSVEESFDGKKENRLVELVASPLDFRSS